jgi:hypothetical protein
MTTPELPGAASWGLACGVPSADSVAERNAAAIHVFMGAIQSQDCDFSYEIVSQLG